MANSRNIRLYLFRVDGVGQNGMGVSGSTDATIERCYIKSARDGSGLPTPYNLSDIQNTTRLLLKDSIFDGATSAMVYFHGGFAIDPRIEGCLFEHSGHDQLKAASYLTRLHFIRNWFGRTQTGNSPGAHDDAFQFQNGGLDGCLFWGNLQWTTPSLWTGGVQGPNQGFYTGSTTAAMDVKNTVFEQNILMNNNRSIHIGGVRPADHTGLIIRNNLSYTVKGTNDDAYCFIDGGVGYKEKNVTVASIIRDNADNGGLYLNTINQNNLDYTASDAHFVTGGPRNLANSYVDKLKVKTTSVMHHAHANKIGPWERIREIVDHTYRWSLANPVIPADVGWPVAPVWQKRWNDNGGVVPATRASSTPMARTPNVLRAGLKRRGNLPCASDSHAC